MRIVISKGNVKMGKLPNISLPPIVACKGCADICGKDCYAMKAYRMYPKVREAWDTNYVLATTDMKEFFGQVQETLLCGKKPVKFFRWHVGGDIPSVEYFKGMLAIAAVFPETKFLCFTKQYGLVNEAVADGYLPPSNLQIVFSAWPGHPIDNRHNFPIAWMQDGTEDRVPADALECHGGCDSCGMCWQLGKVGRDVVFHKH